MLTALSDTQLSTLDSYLNGKEKIPETVDIKVVQQIIAKLTDPQIITRAFEELISYQQQLATKAKPEMLKVSPDVDALLGFSTQIQSRLVASRAINLDEEDLIRDDVAITAENLLHLVAAIQLQVSIDPTQASNSQLIADRYNRRAAINAYLILLVLHLLSNPIIRQGEEEKENPTTWVPLATVQQLSASELLRIVIRSAVVDPQLDQDIDSLLYNFAKAIHLEWSPPVAPESLIWKRPTELYAWVGSQTTRDRIGATITPYLAKLLTGSAQPYDPVFHAACSAMLQAIQLQYQSMPVVTAQPANLPQISPIVTLDTSTQIPRPTTDQVQQIPISTQAPAPLQSAEPAPIPGATVDLRHPTQTPPVQTPPAPEAPTNQQSKIKPINIS